MAKPIGSPKTGGRTKGTPNKKSLKFKEAIEFYGMEPLANLSRILPELPPEKQADFYLRLMNFIYPKRNPTDHFSFTEPEVSVPELDEELRSSTTEPSETQM